MENTISIQPITTSTSNTNITSTNRVGALPMLEAVEGSLILEVVEAPTSPAMEVTLSTVVEVVEVSGLTNSPDRTTTTLQDLDRPRR